MRYSRTGWRRNMNQCGGPPDMADEEDKPMVIEGAGKFRVLPLSWILACSGGS